MGCEKDGEGDGKGVERDGKSWERLGKGWERIGKVVQGWERDGKGWEQLPRDGKSCSGLGAPGRVKQEQVLCSRQWQCFKEQFCNEMFCI